MKVSLLSTVLQYQTYYDIQIYQGYPTVFRRKKKPLGGSLPAGFQFLAFVVSLSN